MHDEGETNNASKSDPGPTILLHYEPNLKAIFFFFLFLLGIGILLLILAATPIHRLLDKFPESCLLILLGTAGAAIARTFNEEYFKSFINDYINAEIFFNFLIPPIILNASYQLYNKHFLFNLDGILLLAVLGTTLNTFAIGLSLYGVYGIQNSLTFLQCLLLSSILAAVDPVAVLAVFNQLNVQKALYMLIFGESLLNDGITIVLFETLAKIAFVKVETTTYLYATLSFIPVALGGSLIGVIYGVFSSFTVKFTTPKVRTLEPTLIFLFAYISYISANIIHWSGVLALISCGLIQKRYGFENISDKARATIELGSSTMAYIAETIIFLALGFKVLDNVVEWDIALILYSILFCTIYRVVFTYLIGWSINTYRLHPLTFNQLFMMSYGGLRGAVAFAMAASLHNSDVHNKFMGATLGVILATVFIQGSSVKYLVEQLKFKEQDERVTFVSITVRQVTFHVLAAMETILGGGGSTIHYWLEKFDRFDKTYVQPLLCRKKSDEYGFQAMLLAEGRKTGDLKMNRIMWGALTYAHEKLDAEVSPVKSETLETIDEFEAKMEKKKAISRFKEAIVKQDKENLSELETKFTGDEELNAAWKRKLALIKAIKAASDEISKARGSTNLRFTPEEPHLEGGKDDEKRKGSANQ